ncbi:hypothetical protein BJ165DRAFT_1410911 [Panaeolus papilionaceus]|nr:hypothetical protein BJ165DRAFT_1410911 [Panaeolus papilionaceus]
MSYVQRSSYSDVLLNAEEGRSNRFNTIDGVSPEDSVSQVGEAAVAPPITSDVRAGLVPLDTAILAGNRVHSEALFFPALHYLIRPTVDARPQFNEYRASVFQGFATSGCAPSMISHGGSDPSILLHRGGLIYGQRLEVGPSGGGVTFDNQSDRSVSVHRGGGAPLEEGSERSICLHGGGRMVVDQRPQLGTAMHHGGGLMALQPLSTVADLPLHNLTLRSSQHSQPSHHNHGSDQFEQPSLPRPTSPQASNLNAPAPVGFPPSHSTTIPVPNSQSTPSSAKSKTFRKRRPAEVNQLQADVREHVDFLLRQAPFDPQSIVSAEEALAFQQTWSTKPRGARLECCDVDNFRVVLHRAPRCAWNMSASRVFAKDFIRQYDRHESEVQKISEAFLVRIGVLQRDYGLSLQSETQRTERREKDRRTKRRKGVFERRLFTVKNHPDLEQYKDDVEVLGWGAMSGDESERDTNPALPFRSTRTNRILPKPRLTGNHIVVEPHWRSPVLTHLLHSLDTLYPIVKNAVGYNQRGQLPHLRIRDHSRQTEGDDFPRGLPLAAYDNEWLMEEPDKASYQVFPNRDVNLRLQELDDAVRRYATDNPSTPPTSNPPGSPHLSSSNIPSHSSELIRTPFA